MELSGEYFQCKTAKTGHEVRTGIVARGFLDRPKRFALPETNNAAMLCQKRNRKET